ncbi:30S ribosomal protein S13 [Picrophilus oshimae]|uniref:Small ribosomal subunit protein uS13 n=2 Tax=Picrophilus torridus (strain ATCC 700027 / DSM 9790 / JCM 10055 / NBRC 100828 / KAW 2/3) TaxID=1122961 RepID=RS13_PICTO|nr:30S ribosomal protein S13 [Picrophilus oshimae]Q6KZP8.1 RecName: Full=Small ribosomal subunit protein uS13; AltName: Full=30S ribosomal protein S13 [Picrophilus oshimae DSM 9789]AAT43804.1 small subunit ribosomal protein S13P [Picrophilus oshimae DSM 9789]SMD31128.1 SSU ribosomal protein S13P [Picrophilus oshimae DSM 9789]
MAEENKNNENFQYIVRIANKDLNGERPLKLALADLKGIGLRLSETIAKKLDLDPDQRIGELGEDKIEELRKYIEGKVYDGIPYWMYNHRRDITTGKDFNLVSNDLDLQINDDINLMKKMRSYKGIRHERGLKVRGQRMRSNGRKGLAIGVVRKKEEKK